MAASRPVRFWESNGGAGPRATPTLNNGRVYAFGATGILNALDAATGASCGRGTPQPKQKGDSDVGLRQLASRHRRRSDRRGRRHAGGLRLATGRRAGSAPSRGSYSSPHLATIDGVPQVLLLGGSGIMSVAPADGTLLWEHAWRGGAIVQPAFTADGDVLINAIAATGGNGPAASRSRTAPADGPPKSDGRRTGSSRTSAIRRAQGLRVRLRRQHHVVHRSRRRKTEVEGRALRRWSTVLLADQDVLIVVSEEGSSRSSKPRRINSRARAIPGARRQDVEPSGPRRQHAPRAQR